MTFLICITFSLGSGPTGHNLCEDFGDFMYRVYARGLACVRGSLNSMHQILLLGYCKGGCLSIWGSGISDMYVGAVCDRMGLTGGSGSAIIPVQLSIVITVLKHI